MADPVDLQALKQLDDATLTDSRGGVFTRVGPLTWQRDDGAVFSLTPPDQLSSLVEALTRYRQWLVKQWQTHEADDRRLDDVVSRAQAQSYHYALAQFDAAVRLEIPEGEQP